MGTPTEVELKQALKQAIEMREQGKDPDFIAKSLLNHHYRLKKMERVIEATKLYLRSGQSPTEHAKVVRALEQYDKIDHESTDYSAFGLE
ncbi:hypothetical protein [Alkalimarinus sediminis]|uniref:Uncharacterized protein n=1 Tax=Alkalimarinus sediminis TaxID=1632866 RepID=A0A9E8HU92_9ALTE|nr:hypothetical protein [Alkalimarinus sediminis]UZW75839.1 hypothetical protein NNL22_04455 [Alkalimarinus sediminis]